MEYDSRFVAYDTIYWDSVTLEAEQVCKEMGEKGAGGKDSVFDPLI